MLIAALMWLAALGTALFAFWALYISLVEHPARVLSGTSAALAEFQESYPRAAPCQAGAAGVALVAGLVVAVLTRDWVWGLAAVSAGAAIPLTLIAIMPTSAELLATRVADTTTRTLLIQWGRLHLIRTVLGLIALAAVASRVRFP